MLFLELVSMRKSFARKLKKDYEPTEICEAKNFFTM